MFWNCLAALLSRCLAEPCLKDINAKLEEEQMMKEVQFMQTNSCGLAMFSGHLWTPCHFASNCHQLQRSKPMAPQRMGEVETAWDVEEAQRWKVVVLCILLQWQDVTGGKAQVDWRTCCSSTSSVAQRFFGGTPNNAASLQMEKSSNNNCLSEPGACKQLEAGFFGVIAAELQEDLWTLGVGNLNDRLWKNHWVISK